MERRATITVCVLHLLDGTTSGCTGCERGHGWNNLAVQLELCCLSAPLRCYISTIVILILYEFQMFTFQFDVFLIWYQVFLLCRISCSIVTETPVWIFVSHHQCLVSSFNMCDQNVTWSPSHCVLLNLLVKIYSVVRYSLVIIGKFLSSWALELILK